MGANNRTHSRAWYWLLLVPMVGVLIPPVYNMEDPTLIGVPFFYWYQLLWVPLSALVTFVVYRRTRRSADR
jgi:Na+-driven multidrug efflux pump